MKLPRDLSGERLARGLERIGYRLTRQTGSHMRLATEVNGPHAVTIPRHGALKVGTLHSILSEIAGHLGWPIAEVLTRTGCD